LNKSSKPRKYLQNDTLVYYTNRKEEDIVELACEMNAMIMESKSKKLKTVSLSLTLFLNQRALFL